MDNLSRLVFSLLRIWLGYTWLTAAMEKLGNPVWTGAKAGAATTGFFQTAIANSGGPHPAVQGWYASFLQSVALPNARFFSYLIPVAEFLVGIALLFGVVTTFSALVGAFLNLNFMLSGSASTNPIMYTIAIIVALGGARAGYLGLDYFVLPWLRRRFGRRPGYGAT